MTITEKAIEIVTEIESNYMLNKEQKEWLLLAFDFLLLLKSTGEDKEIAQEQINRIARFLATISLRFNLSPKDLRIRNETLDILIENLLPIQPKTLTL